jgi:RND family efflux transporter MFP subunit
MKVIQLLIPILATLLVSACSKEEIATSAEPVVRPAKIYTVEDLATHSIRNFPAEVEAHQGSYLAFRVNGELASLNVLPGQTVFKGQVLATLAPEDFQLQVDDRKARYQLAISQFQRTQTLREKNLSSVAQYDEARANMLVAESVYKKAQTDLRYTELRAPFDGTISQKFVENFENIQAKQNVFFLQNQDLLDVSIRVPERIIARVKKGSTYQPSVIFDGFLDQSYLLTIREWDSTADPQTLTYKVVFSLPKPEGFNLLPGMTGNVKIDLSKVMTTFAKGYVIPLESVLSVEEGKGFVWKYNDADNSVVKQSVVVGDVHAEGIEILEGIKEGDQIVAAGGHYIVESMKVRPWSREQGL